MTAKVGIVGYGTQIPRYRIKVEEIAKVWGADAEAIRKGLNLNEKSVPAPDEDCATLAVNAARNALKMASIDPGSIGAVYVGSESHPYAVKPTGTIVSEALGICPNVQSLVCMTLQEKSRTFTGRLHLSYFSDKTLRYLFEKVGFKNEKVEINTCYTGKHSLINYFQFLDPFGDEVYDFLPEKFREVVLDENKCKELEEKMNELGIGLKLRFLAKK